MSRRVYPAVLAAALGLAAWMARTGEARADERSGGTSAPASEKEAPPRPPPLPRMSTDPPAWERHIEIGGDLAIVERPASRTLDGDAAFVRYRPAVGFGLHARWEMFRYLRFSAYFVDARHDIEVREGAFGQAGKVVVPTAETFSFGARLSPTLPFGERGRAWVAAGIGWGRLDLDRMRVLDRDGSSFTVREQGASFAEFPLGLGASFDIVPRWIAIEVELSGSFVTGQEGDALRGVQAVDANGRIRHIGPFPRLDASFVQTVGLSLIL